MKIGILQTGHAPDVAVDKIGDYDAMFAQLLGGHGFEFETFNVVDMEFPSGPDACEGWIVTGSKHGAYEDHAFIPPLEDLIRDVADTKRPMLGICFGHQIIAQAMGGKVEKFDGGWIVGRQTYSSQDQTLAINAWHQDQVVELPPGARVTASSDTCENAALLYGDHIWTLQPHPEFDAEMMNVLVKHRGPGVVPDDLLEAARNGMSEPVHQSAVAAQMAAFLKRGA